MHQGYSVFCMMNSIEITRGGMTKALLTRVNLLQKMNQEINILTFNFNPDYSLIRDRLVETEKLNRQSKIYNMYEFFMQNDTETSSSEKIEIDQMEYTTTNINSKKYYDMSGRLRKLYVSNNNKMETYLFTETGNCFFREAYNPNENKTVYQWINRKGFIINTFHAVTELQQYWLKQLLSGRGNVILISDSRLTDEIMVDCPLQNVAKIVMLHENHLLSPYNHGSPLSKKHKFPLRSLNHLDGFVVLTDRQFRDIIYRFGKRTTLQVIPHPVIPISNMERKVEKTPHTVIMVARYEKIKNITDAIIAFKEVVQAIPNAKLEIYGFGRQQMILENLIQELNLEKNVFLEGFVIDPLPLYRRAAVSILTSKAEGYGLVIAESLNSGTPVIAYDVKYGPSELIANGENGILVEPNNFKQLSKAIITLLKSPTTIDEMSLKAKKISEKFSVKDFNESWMKLFEYSLYQKENRINIDKYSTHLLEAQWNENNPNKLMLEGKLSIEGISREKYKKIELKGFLKKRKMNVGMYFPLSYSINGNEIHYKLNVDFPIHTQSNYEGVYDMYISFSLLNYHSFFRIKANLINGYFFDKEKLFEGNIKITPYKTIKGNLSFEVYGV